MTTKKTFTDEQVSAAISARNFSRSAFYREHGVDEMISIAELLGINPDDLSTVNKVKLTDAIQARAEEIVEINKSENSIMYYEEQLTSWYVIQRDRALELLERLKRAGQEIVDQPYHGADHWKLQRIIDLRAELNVRNRLASSAFKYNDGKWDEPNEGTPALTVMHRSLLREVMREARNVHNKSTSQLVNMYDEIELSHLSKITEDLGNLLEYARENGVEI